MTWFERKYDYEKNFLRLGFDPNDKQYVYYCINEKVPYEKLNKRTKKELNQKNTSLEKNKPLLDELLRSSKIEERKRYLKNIGYPCNSFEALGAIQGSMSGKMESFLNKLTSKENVLLGIHRLSGGVSVEDIHNILLTGLEMRGNSSVGMLQKEFHLYDDVSYYGDNRIVIKELMYADLYRNAPGSILIEIPDKDLEDNVIYIEEDGQTKLNPKYILGYVPVEEGHRISQIITAEQLKREDPCTSTQFYDYSNEQLYETDIKRKK